MNFLFNCKAPGYYPNQSIPFQPVANSTPVYNAPPTNNYYPTYPARPVATAANINTGVRAEANPLDSMHIQHYHLKISVLWWWKKEYNCCTYTNTYV